MKLAKLYAALLAAAALIACAGGNPAADTTAPSTTAAPVTSAMPETTAAPVIGTLPLRTTQVSRIGDKMDKFYKVKFADFVSDAEKFCLTPGLAENFVPQGLARGAGSGWLYVSGYDGDGKQASVIMVLDTAGTLIAEYILHNADGSNFTGHVGGIAVTEDMLYVSAGSDADGNYIIAEFPLSELAVSGSQELRISRTVAVPMGASWLSYADGILWVGNFYLKGSYDLGTIFNFTTTSADGKAYGGYAAAYDLHDAEIKALTVADGEPYAIPDFILACPDRVQGFVCEDGVVGLSLSYGRSNNSTIAYYTVDLEKPDRTLELGGRSYPFTVLDSRNQRASVTAMPMTEGLAPSGDGRVLVLFESGANKYSNASFPTDMIWSMGYR
ncbi:MAG: hypothetical protein IJX53_07720 [Clostridia bacterium]|nr:hypothetical protein [Clostridia bacterium]